MKNFLFELCAESVEAAQAGEFGGADRIELCSRLWSGGVTPDIDLMAATTQAVSIPVHVLIRPRAGDFVYSANEFALMRDQIGQAKQAGAGGVAVGVLCRDGSVDVERSRDLVRLGRPLRVTFHRAFDETEDLSAALEAVIETGADSLLTSGGAADVLAGAEWIARLSKQASGRLEMMAAGGLRLSNLVEVVRRTGISHLHGSLTHRNKDWRPGSLDAGGCTHGSASPTTLEADVRQSVRLLRQEVSRRAFPGMTLR